MSSRSRRHSSKSKSRSRSKERRSHNTQPYDSDMIYDIRNDLDKIFFEDGIIHAYNKIYYGQRQMMYIFDESGHIKLPIYSMTICKTDQINGKEFYDSDIVTSYVSEYTLKKIKNTIVSKYATSCEVDYTAGIFIFKDLKQEISTDDTYVTYSDIPTMIFNTILEFAYNHNTFYDSNRPSAQGKQCMVDRVFMDGDDVPKLILSNPDPGIIGILMNNNAEYATCYRRSELFKAWTKRSNQEYIGIYLDNRRYGKDHLVHKLPYEGVWVYRAWETLDQFPTVRIFSLKPIGLFPIGSEHRNTVSTIHGEVNKIFVLVPGEGRYRPPRSTLPNLDVSYWDIYDPAEDEMYEREDDDHDDEPVVYMPQSVDVVDIDDLDIDEIEEMYRNIRDP